MYGWAITNCYSFPMFLNACILCKHHTNLTASSIQEFKASLANKLMGWKEGRPSQTPPSNKFSVAEHWPTKGADK